jgi:hypothetical protein
MLSLPKLETFYFKKVRSGSVFGRRKAIPDIKPTIPKVPGILLDLDPHTGAGAYFFIFYLLVF